MDTLTHETLRYSNDSQRHDPQDSKSLVDAKPTRRTGEAYVNKSLSFLSDSNTDRTMAGSDYSQGLFFDSHM
jgi:hypothetical protein